MRKRGKLITAGLIGIFILSIVAGVLRDEIPDVVSNARILCFSCIGLK